jgi:hypothetical protein
MAAGIVSVAMYHQRGYALAVAMLCLTGVDLVVLL